MLKSGIGLGAEMIVGLDQRVAGVAAAIEVGDVREQFATARLPELPGPRFTKRPPGVLTLARLTTSVSPPVETLITMPELLAMVR